MWCGKAYMSLQQPCSITEADNRNRRDRWAVPGGRIASRDFADLIDQCFNFYLIDDWIFTAGTTVSEHAHVIYMGSLEVWEGLVCLWASLGSQTS